MNATPLQLCRYIESEDFAARVRNADGMPSFVERIEIDPKYRSLLPLMSQDRVQRLIMHRVRALSGAHSATCPHPGDVAIAAYMLLLERTERCLQVADYIAEIPQALWSRAVAVDVLVYH